MEANIKKSGGLGQKFKENNTTRFKCNDMDVHFGFSMDNILFLFLYRNGFPKPCTPSCYYGQSCSISYSLCKPLHLQGSTGLGERTQKWKRTCVDHGVKQQDIKTI